MKFFTILLSSILFFTIGCQSLKAGGNSDVLWHFINDQCVPNQKTSNSPAPCEEVTFPANSSQGYVVFKDRKGPLQYLLMPATKITGIEDAQILNADAVNYFFEAWKARSYMIKKYNGSVPDEEISLAINSERGRSQNQLHIHISCIRPEVKKEIQERGGSVDSKWALFPGGILKHRYYARTIKLDQLNKQNPFQLLFNELPEAKNNMGDFGMGIIATKNSFILVADRYDQTSKDWAWAEEIQDHNCPQLFNGGSHP